MKKKKELEFEMSSGNIFADLGLDNPEERLVKAELARQINNLISNKELNQSQAAKLLGVDQPKISYLSKGKLDGFSIERLFRFLNILGQNITIKISPVAPLKQRATLTVKNIKPLKDQSISTPIKIQAKKK